MLLYLFQVKYVISRHPSVQKISFVGHSLGGLVARYAIARLYEQDLTQEISQTNGDCGTDHLGDSCPEGKFKGKIAGLEPMNFITFASPHLGSRWHKQVVHSPASLYVISSSFENHQMVFFCMLFDDEMHFF